MDSQSGKNDSNKPPPQPRRMTSEGNDPNDIALDVEGGSVVNMKVGQSQADLGLDSMPKVGGNITPNPITPNPNDVNYNLDSSSSNSDEDEVYKQPTEVTDNGTNNGDTRGSTAN